MEACFYECDHNMGKYRKYNNSACDPNGWEISGLPLAPSLVNAWFNACSSDLFCTAASGSYYELPTLAADACTPPPAGSPAGTETATCKKFSTIYSSPTDFITRLWDGSFSVASSGGFVFPEPGDVPFDNITVINPNNAASTRPDPPFCGFRPTVSGWIQAMNDFKLYVANMGTYAGQTFTGTPYGLTATLANASWWTIQPDAAEPATTCSAAPALRVVAVVGAAALAALAMA